MREDEKLWARFQHGESYRWGGDPGEQLQSVPVALKLLGDEWLLCDVALIGRSDVAYLCSPAADEFWLTFDYVEGSPTEGTWGFRFSGGDGESRERTGFQRPQGAVAAFVSGIG